MRKIDNNPRPHAAWQYRHDISVSATNRKPRAGEIDGVHYHFLSTGEFHDRIAAGDFLEYEEVYPGRLYGTLKSEINRALDAAGT